MDKFKQYLNTHLDELGNDDPGDRVWQNLQNNMQPVRRMGFQSSFFKYAAAACFLILSAFGVWFFRFDAKPVVKPVMAAKTSTPAGDGSKSFNQSLSEKKNS